MNGNQPNNTQILNAITVLTARVNAIASSNTQSQIAQTALLTTIAAGVKAIQLSLATSPAAGATPQQLDTLKSQIDAADQALKPTP